MTPGFLKVDYLTFSMYKSLSLLPAFSPLSLFKLILLLVLFRSVRLNTLQFAGLESSFVSLHAVFRSLSCCDPDLTSVGRFVSFSVNILSVLKLVFPITSPVFSSMYRFNYPSCLY